MLKFAFLFVSGTYLEIILYQISRSSSTGEYHIFFLQPSYFATGVMSGYLPFLGSSCICFVTFVVTGCFSSMQLRGKAFGPITMPQQWENLEQGERLSV